MSLYLMPHRGASLSTWSFGDGTPHFDLSGEYFVFYSHGLDVHTWTFWFEIQVLRNARERRVTRVSGSNLCRLSLIWSLQDLYTNLITQ